MTHQQGWLTSGEFAKLCDTSKETLRHYRDIGLLKPRYVGENGYLYYDAEQFYEYYAIAIFKKTGTPLSEIEACLRQHDLSVFIALLQKQQIKLAQEQRKLEQMAFIVENSIANLSIGVAGGLQNLKPERRYCPCEHLLAIPQHEFLTAISGQQDEEGQLMAVLKRCKEISEYYQVQTDYQMGAIIPMERILVGAQTVSHLYARVDKAYINPYYLQKPAGDYLCVLSKGDWDNTAGYSCLLEYLRHHRLETVGSVYAYDLAGFVLNGLEQNAMTLISVQLAEPDRSAISSKTLAKRPMIEKY